MPSVYIDHFSELQDNVPTHPVNETKSELSKSLLKYHGLHFDEVFETFIEEPLGSASIGSVHAATLTNNFLRMNESSYSGGKEVTVKVMHVDAENRFRNDFKLFKVSKGVIIYMIFKNIIKVCNICLHNGYSVLFIHVLFSFSIFCSIDTYFKWVCRIALPGWSPILPELERQFMTEFDYMNEAANLKSVRENMLNSPYRNHVYVPEPLLKFSTRNVLIMEKLEGEKIASDAERKLTSALNGDKTLAKRLMEERRKGELFLRLPST